MGDIVEILSDSSEDTIILTPEYQTTNSEDFNIDDVMKKYSKPSTTSNVNKGNILNDSGEDTVILEPGYRTTNSNDFNIDDVLKKYSSTQTSCDSNPSTSSANFYSLDDFSDDELIAPPLIKRIKSTNSKSDYGSLSSDDFGTSSQDSGRSSTVDDESQRILKELNSKYSKNDCKEDMKGKKLAKQQNAEQKRLEKESARLEKAREKAVKDAMQSIQKTLKPDECMKYITVNVDEGIFKQDYGEIVRQTLENSMTNFRTTSQMFPNTITWTRSVHALESSSVNVTKVEEKNVLLFMDCFDLLKHVEESTLVGYIQSIYSFLEIKQLTLAVYGLNDFYNYLKDERNKRLQSEVSRNTKKTSKHHNKYKDFPKVSRKSVEMALVELQVMCNCYFKPLNSYEDVSMIVTECTKAVAQLPYKLEKQQKYQQETEWFGGDNKDCVRVDKNGNGLSRLWMQILTLFPLARLETAEAIAAIYTNPTALRQAYINCSSKQEGENLLKDVPVRRAAGPLTSIRKIGPELSKKIHKFFTSEEENILL